MPLITKFLLIT